MQVDKNNIGDMFYFIETKSEYSEIVVHYGELISVLPKYMFLDKFNSKYSREQIFLFRCKTYKNNIIHNITVSDQNLIFKSFYDASGYFKDKDVLFGASILIKEVEDGRSEFEI